MMLGFVSALLLAAAPPVAVEHVRVMVGDGTTLENATVVMREGRFVSVGQAPAPAGATRIDGSHRVLTPGLVETRTHLGLSEVDQEETTNDFQVAKHAASPAFHAADGFNAASVRIPIVREEGITSVVSAPAGLVLYGTGAWVDLSDAACALVMPPVAMFGGVGRSAAEAVGGARGGIWLLLREINDDVRFYQKNHALIDRGESRSLSLKPMHLRAMQPVLERNLPLVLHADRASDIARALRFAKEENIRLVISGGAEAWLVAPALVAASVPVILRPSLQQPNSFDELRSREDSATQLAHAGVAIILSAGFANQDIVRLRQEAGHAVALGLPHAAALTAITLTPARVFGKDKELGSISVGKRANAVLWSDDPFETRSVTEKIWIDGVLQPGGTRQQALAQRYMNR